MGLGVALGVGIKGSDMVPRLHHFDYLESQSLHENFGIIQMISQLIYSKG